VRPAQGGAGRLSQGTGGKKTAVAQRCLRVEQQDIHIPGQAAVLEGIVQHKDVGPEFFHGQEAGDATLRAGDHRNPGEVGGQQGRLVAAFFRGKEDPASVGDHVAAAGPAAAVAPAQDGRPETPGLQTPGGQHGQRCLSRSPHGEVADADHRTGKARRLDHAGVVAAVSPCDGRSVGPGKGDEAHEQRQVPSCGWAAVP